MASMLHQILQVGRRGGEDGGGGRRGGEGPREWGRERGGECLRGVE